MPQTAHKISSFVVDPNEILLYAGNLHGEVLVIRVHDLEVLFSLPVHFGCIEVMAMHPTQPYISAMSMDRSVSLIDVSDPLHPKLVERYSFRNVKCSNDEVDVPANYSLSQALAFHPTARRLAVRSGNAGVLELDFSDGPLRVLHCTRFHGQSDVVALRYVMDGEALLSGAGGSVVLSSQGEVLRRWSFGNYNLHWFEPVGDEHYLVACDELYVIRLDVSDRQPPVFGERLTRDDLEHVTFNRKTARAFAAGFDGDVYEVDPVSCSKLRVAWRAPYKLRWIKVLERNPDALLAYCFNGGIYKVSLAEQRIVARSKGTPNAVWSVVRAKDRLLFVGEGDVIRPVNLTGVDLATMAPEFTLDDPIAKGVSGFTKRMVSCAGGLLLAQRLGQVWRVDDNGSKMIVDLTEELRDIAVDEESGLAFACTERGRVVKFNSGSGQILGVFKSDHGEPFWSLAYHPKRKVLATAERRGELFVLDTETMRPIFSGGYRTGRPKRMKWCDDSLLYVQTSVLRRFDLTSHSITELAADCENTIEDFIWDEGRNYLVLVGYRTEIVLCDFQTGEIINSVPDQADFTKGLVWVTPKVTPGGYALDFITFGRSGTAHLFRVHNERCLALGPIAPNLLGREP